MDESNLNTLLKWLEVLGNGYVKPDTNKDTRNNTGTIRDSKDYKPYMDEINTKLCEHFQLSCDEIKNKIQNNSAESRREHPRGIRAYPIEN